MGLTRSAETGESKRTIDRDHRFYPIAPVEEEEHGRHYLAVTVPTTAEGSIPHHTELGEGRIRAIEGVREVWYGTGRVDNTTVVLAPDANVAEIIKKIEKLREGITVTDITQEREMYLKVRGL